MWVFFFFRTADFKNVLEIKKKKNVQPEIKGEFLQVCWEAAVTAVSAPWDPTDGKSACHNRHNQ